MYHRQKKAGKASKASQKLLFEVDLKVKFIYINTKETKGFVFLLWKRKISWIW